jgi:hypothetical protein
MVVVLLQRNKAEHNTGFQLLKTDLDFAVHRPVLDPAPSQKPDAIQKNYIEIF